MLHPKLEEKLRSATLALDRATSENIIELCKQYLALLAAYRDELYKLPDTLELNLRSRSTSSPEELNRIRKAVRAAIERTTHERNRAEALLLSFTTISGYGAVETFNSQKYKGRDDWQLSASGVSASDGAGTQRMTMQEAVEAASLLRREQHVATSAATAGAQPFFNSPDISGPRPQP
ncbi:MAG: hypothetical protein WBP93_01060 [Pyrinomonadaceae bacterium]